MFSFRRFTRYRFRCGLSCLGVLPFGVCGLAVLIGVGLCGGLLVGGCGLRFGCGVVCCVLGDGLGCYDVLCFVLRVGVGVCRVVWFRSGFWLILVAYFWFLCVD